VEQREDKERGEMSNQTAVRIMALEILALEF
jgi:hypothetical protein